MRKHFPLLLFLSLFVIQNLYANGLLDESLLKTFSEEISGETAKRNLEFISREHRMRASRGFQAAITFIAGELRKYGLEQIKIEEFPADGKQFYGTQRSRPSWDVNFAELWEMKQTSTGLVQDIRLASWDAVPLSLAQDSESGEVTAELVDAGDGVTDSDYSKKDVKGKLVLISQQPELAVRLAIEKYKQQGSSATRRINGPHGGRKMRIFCDGDM